ncbi:saccharopine dehydrogenase family protein [Marinobacter zhejiangensis]|uniref:Uncharacterized conserved protein n=1 Tax=Marinobacter zhejiangensis TaxID=488535 RepID=A0A1I4RXP2_9GAMM|nr:saccharopine dehydrogenase NADP-binding domain-containing protein [Marinobacter zhejiangensis]SFM56941.1 Uncharacterized conserved protein [Marinobacter zhejiangensis]
MENQNYDLVVFGATSFVGQILCHYLASQYGTDKDLKWAIAGRSMSKLDALKRDLDSTSLPVLQADAADLQSLTALCEKTRVVISTVGPYALYGEPLIRACVQTGTDYCDLTGEVQWIRQMITRYEEQAQASGARIVHCCGFDSIPSDLGVWFLQNEATKNLGEPCTQVKMRVKAARGGLSGGTVASLINVTKEAAANPQLRKELANPFSLAPEGHKSNQRQPNVKSAEYDPDFDVWLAPFMMAPINVRIVHRSNALQGAPYTEEFLYDEAMMTGKGMKGRLTALGITAALGSFIAGAAIKPTRWVLEKFVVPKPGEGPSPEAQKNGFYDLRFLGMTASGKTVSTKVTGDMDPGYGSTGKMLGEAGVCLALDIDKASTGGGFWTPASIFGEKLVNRLCENAGLTFERVG